MFKFPKDSVLPFRVATKAFEYLVQVSSPHLSTEQFLSNKKNTLPKQGLLLKLLEKSPNSKHRGKIPNFPSFPYTSLYPPVFSSTPLAVLLAVQL